MAYVKTKTEFFGLSSVVQLLGILLLFGWPFGTILGILLFLVGCTMARRFVCSKCGNRVRRGVLVCPACHVEFCTEDTDEADLFV